MSSDPSLPAPPGVEHCYRHPSEQTGVHCTRCGRPICPACMIEAPVGYQCPECVAEAKREFRKGPGRRIAVANAKGASLTTLLLLAITGMYLLEVIPQGVGAVFEGPTIERLVELGGSIGYINVPGLEIGIAAGQYWRLFTSMFLHANLIHLGLNAYALFLFGHIIERELGRLRFALIYVCTGLFAGAVSFAFSSPFGVAIGASGAIFGLFGAFFAYNYRRRSSALAAARIRQMVMLLAINLFLGFSIPGIDWRAHVGGFLGGLVAGYVAEGSGDAARRQLILIAGFASILVATAVIVVVRSTQLTG
jgi:membrane associated rhomboid family serine protease